MRPVAVGRKNYLFMGSEAGGKSAAIAYTLIETAKMNKVNPRSLACLGAGAASRTIQRSRINDLMPWAYQDMINARNAEAEANDAA